MSIRSRSPPACWCTTTVQNRRSDAGVRHAQEGAGQLAFLVVCPEGHPCSARIDGRVFEASLASLRRARGTDSGESVSDEKSAGSQDRCPRQPLVSRTAGAWRDPPQLRAAARDPPVAGSHTLPGETHRGTQSYPQPHPQGARRCMLETGHGGQQHSRPNRAARDSGHHRGPNRSCVLAEYAQGTLRGKQAELTLALRGRVTDHHRFLLGELMEDLQFVESKIERLDRQIAAQTDVELVARLCTIPGVDLLTAWTMLAELGSDIRVFASLSSCRQTRCPEGDCRSGSSALDNRVLPAPRHHQLSRNWRRLLRPHQPVAYSRSLPP